MRIARLETSAQRPILLKYYCKILTSVKSTTCKYIKESIYTYSAVLDSNGVSLNMGETQRLHPSPIYAQIREALRERVAAGSFAADMPLNEVVLAGEFGASRETVRRALVELKAEGLLKRVRGKGTFVRESYGPARRSRRATIAIVTPGCDLASAGPALSRFLHTVQVACERQDLRVSYCAYDEPHTSFVARLREDKTLRGVIAIWMDDQQLLHGLADLPIPVILLESVQPENGPVLDEVQHECVESVAQAVSSLIQWGHHDIAIMESQGTNSIVVQRHEGFERALAAAGLPIRPEFIYRISYSADAAYGLMNELLKQGTLPTAFFCTGDEMASAVIFSALEHGLRVPRDLSVIGFGDTATFVSPPLSTIRIPAEQMACEAVRILCERLKHPSRPVQRIALPAAWISRSSCAVPRPVLLKSSAGGIV